MLTKILIALIRVYQETLSRLLLAVFGPACRFEPSCSRYAVACLQGHGALRGTLLSVKRLCKCHPFHPGGYDPPPPPPPAHLGGAEIPTDPSGTAFTTVDVPGAPTSTTHPYAGEPSTSKRVAAGG